MKEKKFNGKMLTWAILSIVLGNVIGVAVCAAIDTIRYGSVDAEFSFLLLGMVVPIIMCVIDHRISYRNRSNVGEKWRLRDHILWLLIGMVGCLGMCVLATLVLMTSGGGAWYAWVMTTVCTMVGMIVAVRVFRAAN